MTRDFAAELAELQRNYLASLPGKLDELAAAIARRSASETRHLAHKLRGTAASYFAPAVSTAAAAIEDAVESDAPDWPAIDQLMATARKVAGELS
jgi:HPt (histidine-containing phosphotransfer) domain-containing protein